MLEQPKNIFFLGIKGVAMANLGVILKKMGKNVTGCDVQEEFITDKLLRENDISWMIGFDPQKLPKKTDLIVYSAAHGGTNNPLIIEAIKNNINTISQAKLLGELMDQFENKIAVCGCHGKTTTSSLLAYALNKLKQKPSYLVGVPFFTGYQGGDFQGKKYFVVEADEYGVNPPVDKTPKFHLLNPNYIIATNIDFDHPDVYKDIEETKEAFKKLFIGLDSRLRGNDKTAKKLILCADDKNLIEVARSLPKDSYLTYGESGKANYQIINCKISEDESSFEIMNVGKFKISLFGKHNISNATAVIVQLLELGFKPDEIQKALIGFNGAERRFELVYKKNNIFLFDDYAHHPTEIAATIKAAKNRFSDRRIIVIFQPHTYSRTSNLLKEFGESLSLADISLILPIFASARENPKDFNVSSKDIVVKIKDSLNKDCLYSESKEQLINQLGKILEEGDVVFTMGAGDVYKLKEEIIQLINSKQIANYELRIEKNKDLVQFNTLRTSAVAEYFLEARTREDLIEGKKFAFKNKLQLLIISGGSNLAIVKNEIKGLVIKNSYKELKILEETDANVLLSVSSGYPVSLLVNETINKGYQGFEYHKGLPGMVGGAVYMNSKWTKPVSYFGDNLVMGYLVSELGEVKQVNRDYFMFDYDYSILQKTKEIILEAVFRLKKVDPQILKIRSSEAFEYRKKTQPMGEKTSGCFFRNIDGKSAGQMIDQAGLKDFSIGDFYVSPIHANFIINRGKGKSKDLIELVRIIKERVKKKFGVKLEEEVIII
ncbi:MAG: UDP-N-acetylmuramate--L-alanine ligase [Patescibacteria group bacterium]|jgi:UDP-N-acetylmuramate--L-alanine ligase/UDP-N-acetylenolpyruvoylglucosamine reductase